MGRQKSKVTSCKATAFKDATWGQLKREAIHQKTYRPKQLGLFEKVKAMFGIKPNIMNTFSGAIFAFSDNSFLSVRASGETTAFLCNGLVDDWGKCKSEA
ncbi:hypothetical protein A8H39_01535 [Paraburkholderia fungorum]|uniref:hypothetical protein n=1 Tax=Paraburkholderia fungorum TaxID=134537 RepID=UPI0004870FCD|nr:hypothetical protein [Paraburkholderia fungorum]MBB5546666.1 hypothetical protein [Paraburkholderia fungorum]PNE59856.1 hypothetical protein A8H39_01535 [Paraburkholderia fungorum]